jgi:hypothetical protein
MRKLPSVMILLVLSLGCVGCNQALPAVPTQTQYPTDTLQAPTLTASATIVWFPPTATFTALPTQLQLGTPTPLASVTHGELIYADDFDDPTKWTLGRSGSGLAALGPYELTLAINQPAGYLYSLHQGAKLGNFYAEITASPTICRGDDEYGLLLRVSPDLDFYRFSLTCDGQTRVDKYYQGKASSPVPLTMSGAVPRGAPSASRLAVLAIGKEIHFFINGEFQFTVRDPSLSAGELGVFARAGGEDAVTVNFSDLAVYAVAGGE